MENASTWAGCPQSKARVCRETSRSCANAWGACDEDLFRWTLREADQAAAAGKPFHFFVMTTSNHRPFTYPEGKIDLPSKDSGRDGAVWITRSANAAASVLKGKVTLQPLPPAALKA